MSIDDQLTWRDREAVAAMRNKEHFKMELAEQAESERLEHQPPRRALQIVVTGSRDWTNNFLLRAVLSSYLGHGTGVQFHVGDARGVDRVTKQFCDGLVACRVYRADWSTGKGAGFKRNIEMLETAKPDLVLAFKSGPTSAGTDHTIREAKKRGIHVIEIVDHAAPVEPKKGEIPFYDEDLARENDEHARAHGLEAELGELRSHDEEDFPE